eukprot:TRINITY_DN16696_c0_g1_i1.p1 TRINITY_DN16696_c0_g1~~TRINITY_DN16696_c0_g1_i1.p1  ORF type:complete len:206 (-),score=25.80 TRINITY_DN16696_c0_g1_i1:52-669(-)
MEHADCTHREWLKSNKSSDPADFKFKLMMIKRIIKTVRYIHKSGFICVDVSPNNFVLMKGEDPRSIKMIDFEGARRGEEVKIFTKHLPYTLGNIAPELHAIVETHENNPSKKTENLTLKQSHDAFSVGAVILFILCNQSFIALRPYGDTETFEQYKEWFDKEVDNCYSPLMKLDADIFEPLRNLIRYDWTERSDLEDAVRALYDF